MDRGFRFWLQNLFYGLDVVNEEELADFSSDDCSLFLDGNFEDPELWKKCCILHDIAYL